tara:strand:- start:692 stop:1687 length:996 start_codon:yes stop_codon:yes gene_type:complete
MLILKREFMKFSLLNLLLFFFIKLNLKANDLKNTKVLTNFIFFEHIISPDHPEKPERIKYILDDLKKSKNSSLLEIVDTNRNVQKWIKEIHFDNHINSLRKLYPLAEKVSRYAVKVCLTGVDKIMRRESKNIFCAVRPPGHHALNTGKDEGFCYYNHIAITAKYIQKKFKLKKILIVDWDYHHGNSTEHFFYSDPNVLFFSTHDQFAYPGTGSPERRGNGEGLGFNINVHLPCKTKDEQILKVFNQILIPNVHKFKPDFILISAGFDSRINDTLGCFNLTDNCFRKLTRILAKLSKLYCENRILSILEGGYNLDGNAKATLTHIGELNNIN